MTDSSKKTIKEIILGMAVYLVVMSIPVLIFTRDKIKGEGGLIAGVLAAVLMLISMNASIWHAAHMQKGQSGYMAMVSVARLLLVAGFLFAIGWFQWLNVFTAVIGVMSLKAATYLQPFTARLLEKAKLNK